MNIKRLLLVVCLLGASYGAFILRQQAQEADLRLRIAQSIPRPQVAAVVERPWRWATESEWAVYQTVRSLVSWTSLFGGEPNAAASIKVHRKPNSVEPGVFDVDVTTPTEARKWVIEFPDHAWDPGAYAAIAKDLIGASPATQGAHVEGVGSLLLTSDTASLRKADGLLFSALKAHPRDAGLHAQAALLWSAYGLRESEGAGQDGRPYLNGMVAHLALVSALSGATADASKSPETELAGAALDTLLARQTEALTALDRTEAAEPRAEIAAWTKALRLRITHDPRLIPEGTPPSRLVQLESLIAVGKSQSCESAMRLARLWRHAPSADARGFLRCTEQYTEFAGDPIGLLMVDAAKLLDTMPKDLQSVVATLRAVSDANTHQPQTPTAIIPLEVRSDAGLRHIGGAFETRVSFLRRMARPDDIQRLILNAEFLWRALPRHAALQQDLISASGGRAASLGDFCEEITRLIIDRPDLLEGRDWYRASTCGRTGALRMIGVYDWTTLMVSKGTGLMERGPWHEGGGDVKTLDEAFIRAPWMVAIGLWNARRKNNIDPPTPAVLKVYERVIDYDSNAMGSASAMIHDDDALVERLVERACEIDVESCAASASRIAAIGREETAIRLWKRALDGSKYPITLANEMPWYVNILIARGEIEEGMRLANMAAGVYSARGLFALGSAYEQQGKFDEALSVYRKVTERYNDPDYENAFFIRHAQRYGESPYAKETTLALAEAFPKGIRRKTFADFQKERYQGCVRMELGRALSERLWRVGVRNFDCLVSIDGYVVEDEKQLAVVLGFTDEAPITAVVEREEPARRLVQLEGNYRRWIYGQTPKPAVIP